MCNWAFTIFGFSLKVLTCSSDIVRELNNFNWEPLPVNMETKDSFDQIAEIILDDRARTLFFVFIRLACLIFSGFMDCPDESVLFCINLAHFCWLRVLWTCLDQVHKNVNSLELLKYIFENNSPKGSFWGNKRKLEFSDLSSGNLHIFWQLLLFFFPASFGHLRNISISLRSSAFALSSYYLHFYSSSCYRKQNFFLNQPECFSHLVRPHLFKTKDFSCQCWI